MPPVDVQKDLPVRQSGHRPALKILGVLAVAVLALTVPGPLAAIADPITLSVSGQITSVEGAPVTNAVVTLHSGDPRTALMETTTDGTGRYSFALTESGAYQIKATAIGRGTRWLGDDPRFVYASTITIRPDRVENVAVSDIHLPDIEYVLSGTVTGGNPPVPLAGVGVLVKAPSNGETDTVLTDAEGNYRLEGLPQSGSIKFIAPVGYASEWFDDVPDQAHATVIQFDSDKTVNATLAAAGSISGTVRGAMPDGSSIALGKAEVTLYTVGGAKITTVVAATNGSYTFDRVAVGSYRIGFSYPYRPVDWVGAMYGGGRLSLSRIIVLGTTANISGIDVVLNRTPVISGVVLNGANAQPVNAARVTLRSLNGDPLKDTTTTSAGAYEFRGVASGTYLVQVWDSGTAAGTWFGGGSSYESATALTLLPNATSLVANVTLPRAGSIAGSVSASDISVVNTRVTLTSLTGGEIYERYVNSGAFSFSGVHPGDYYIRFTPPNNRLHASWWTDGSPGLTRSVVRVTATETTRLGNTVFTPRATGRIRGVIRGGANTEVELYGANWVGQTVTADAQGNYQFSNIPAGTYFLQYADGQYYRGNFTDRPRETITVKPGLTTAAKTAVLSRTVDVSFAISSNGRFTEAAVEFYDLKGEVIESALSDPDGYTSAELPPGRYKVRFSTHDGDEIDTSQGIVWLGNANNFATSPVLDLRSVETATISATLPGASTFSATVTDSMRRPLSGVSAIAWERQPNGTYTKAGRAASTDYLGRFIIRGLGTGTYKIQFTSSGYGTTWLGGSSQATARLIAVSPTSRALTTTTTTRLASSLGAVGVRMATITGTVKLRKQLTAVVSETWPATRVSFSYQWFRDGVAIPRAVGATYTVAPADMERVITVQVTASAVGYSSSGSLSEPRNSRD